MSRRWTHAVSLRVPKSRYIVGSEAFYVSRLRNAKQRSENDDDEEEQRKYKGQQTIARDLALMRGEERGREKDEESEEADGSNVASPSHR